MGGARAAPNSGRNRSKSPYLADRGRIPPKPIESSRVRTNSAQFWAISTSIGQFGPVSTNFGPTSTDSGEIWLKLDDWNRANFGRFGPTWAKLDQRWTNVGPTLTKVCPEPVKQGQCTTSAPAGRHMAMAAHNTERPTERARKRRSGAGQHVAPDPQVRGNSTFQADLHVASEMLRVLLVSSPPCGNPRIKKQSSSKGPAGRHRNAHTNVQ